MGDKPILGGNKGLPPLELPFLPYITDALAFTKLTYPTATFVDATATKKTSPLRGLDISARFRVQDGDTQVTVTGDDKSSFQITDPTTIRMGSVDILGLDKLANANDPVTIVVNNKKVQGYSSFRLYKLDSSTLRANKKLVDQPYYDFFDDKKAKLGSIGATDGKDYLGVK